MRSDVFQYVEKSWRVLIAAGSNFIDDNCFRSSASLSFYTLFSIAPILVITISVFGFFLDDFSIREQMSENFQRLLGVQGAEGILVLMDTIRTENNHGFSLILGVGILLFSATTIFIQIKDSFNEIFEVRPRKGKMAIFKFIRDRLISVGLIFSLGFAMIISLAADAILLFLVDVISQRNEEISLILLQIFQNILMLSLVFLIIFALFKFLPDAIIPRKYNIFGAGLTTFLLLAGKFMIGWYIGNSNLSELGGASASVILLMLWVYYSSLLLFFGAEIIKAQSLLGKQSYHPGPFSRKVRIVEVNDAGKEISD